MKPAISVLVPVYNVEPFLERCLDSILAGGVDDIEVVCVDDCSPDGSAAILAHRAASDPRIRVERHGHNRGLMQARRTGYMAARGEYIFFCDSDDTIPAGALRTLLAAARASGADITAGDIEVMRADGPGHRLVRHGRIGPGYLDYFRAILTGSSPQLMGALYKASLFADGGFEAIEHQNFSEDRILLTDLLLARHPSIHTIADVTYYYQVNGASITRVHRTPAMVSSQFAALYRNYRRIDAAEPSLRGVNRYFMTRYLSLYLEQGTPRQSLLDTDPESVRLLSAGELRRNVGLRLAWHTLACMYVPLYARCATAARNLIRRIQRKV
ncbi:MAG: glycosyltransferase [Bacteroides sp.]|nr:glycosyltransferase [Bacteroides sp.]